MPIYKKHEKALPETARRLLAAATKAIVPNNETDREWKNVPGAAVGKPCQPYERLEVARLKAAAVAGAKLVSGWCLEEIRRKGLMNFAVVLEHHTVIEMPGGQLLCPCTPAGESIQFVVDPERQHDDALDARWNTAFYSNTTFKGSLGVAPAYKLCWATTWGNDQAFSSQERHSKFISWGKADPIAALERQNEKLSRLDVVMCSDMNELMGALGASPHPAELPDEKFFGLVGELRKMQSTGILQVQATPTTAPVSEPETV